MWFVDLKLGNICNLKCRICGSWSSSKWAQEEIDYIPELKNKKEHLAYKFLQQGAWPRKTQTFWDNLRELLPNIKYFEFTGGEPFMIQEHFDLLQYAVDQGYAKNIDIHYNTNGTQWPERGPDIWRHFKTVEIAFSIDDIGARFEYQRTNADWAVVLDNITSFQYLKTQMPNLQLQCCSTVNVFNVRYIDGLARWIVLQDFDFVYWNMMHDAWYFSIATLPDTAKASVTEYLHSADIPPEYREEFDRIIKFMNTGASTDGFMLRMKIADLDRKRNQRLRAVEPELADLIEYE